MARKNRCGSIIAALGMFASILAVGHEAQAAGSKLTVSKGGIVVVGGGGAGTDPPYTYQFDVSLTGTLNKYSVFSTPTSITFQNLVGRPRIPVPRCRAANGAVERLGSHHHP